MSNDEYTKHFLDELENPWAFYEPTATPEQKQEFERMKNSFPKHHEKRKQIVDIKLQIRKLKKEIKASWKIINEPKIFLTSKE